MGKLIYFTYNEPEYFIFYLRIRPTKKSKGQISAYTQYLIWPMNMISRFKN